MNRKQWSVLSWSFMLLGMFFILVERKLPQALACRGISTRMKISITGGYIAGAIIFSFQYIPQLACLGLATCDSVNFDKFWKIMLLLLLGFMFLLIMMSDNKNTITKNKAF